MRVCLDNTTRVAYINHKEVQEALLLHWSETNLALSGAHVAGKENVQADFLSQHQLDPGEWSLETSVFHSIVQLLGHANYESDGICLHCQSGPLLQPLERKEVRTGHASANLANELFPLRLLIGHLLQRIEPHQRLRESWWCRIGCGGLGMGIS